MDFAGRGLPVCVKEKAMSVSYRSHLHSIIVHVMSLGLLAGAMAQTYAVAQETTDAQTEGTTKQNDLSWKPHRFATAQPRYAEGSSPPRAETIPDSSTVTRDVAQNATTPPASVSLPDKVPAATPMPIRPRKPQTAPYAPLRGSIAEGMQQMGDWFTTAGKTSQQSSAPQTTDMAEKTFVERMMRTPQGPEVRPNSNQDTRYASTQPEPTQRLGGGLAPRYEQGPAETNRPGSTGTRRQPERVAMNVDGIPSVMTRAPQAAAIDTSPRMPQGTASNSSDSKTMPQTETIDPPLIIETTPEELQYNKQVEMDVSPADGMWMGRYPAEMHVESFYDDPYACDEEGGALPFHCCDGRICRWLRRLGKPYYGWRWYRDFTASAGVTGFQNEDDFGTLGNFGVNEYLNWSMPLWNAFGIGWQVGVRGVQSNFHRSTIGTLSRNNREQTFVTTGFFTRAFKGRGLQGGVVWDYLHDSYFENINVAQVRSELSYVWGYHEFGFWGAQNVAEEGIGFIPTAEGSSENLYTAFYRLQFGDANEWRVWGGSTATQAGIVGSSIRAPLSKSLAIEGTFTHLFPGRHEQYTLNPPGGGAPIQINAQPKSWNVSINIVYYPARRARRSLASPYRPLFDVADNGSLIRSIKN